MNLDIDAGLAGTFRIGGEIPVNRLGFGAMRMTGPGIWGPPQDRLEALRTLEILPMLGVNFVDTADSYGPHVSEELIREVLSPYTNILVATKAGLTRSGPDQWAPNGDPAYLRRQAHESRKRLGVDQIALWQLHRIDPRHPREAQFEAVRSLIDEGVIRYAGLSEVSVAEIEAASRHFPVATVQNQYNLVDRRHDDVLAYCEARGIGFIPWFPLGAGSLTSGNVVLERLARSHGVSSSQIALAWTLSKSPVMIPIPGTSKAAHLTQNVAAAAIMLSEEDRRALDQIGRRD